MRIRLDESDLLLEMATINPGLCKDFKLQVSVVQGGEGPYPHMHVFSKSANLDTCIALCSCDYFEHGPHKGKLTKDQKEKFLRIINTPTEYYMKGADGVIRELNGYQYAVTVWVSTYESGSYDKFNLDEYGMPIPVDYSNLKTSKTGK